MALNKTERHPVRHQRHRPAVVVGSRLSGAGRLRRHLRRRSSPRGQMVIPVGTPVLVRGTSRDVIHSWWIPRLNGKRDMVPGRVQTNRIAGRRAGHLRRPVHRVLRPVARQHAHGGRRAVPRRTSRRGRPTSSRRTRRPKPGTLAAEGEAAVHLAVLALPPGQRPRRRRRRTRSSHVPTCTSTPEPRRTSPT